MANISLSRIAGRVLLVRSTQTKTKGGSRETEQNALTVKPARTPWLRVVTTETPVVNWPATCRKKSFSIVMYRLSFDRTQCCASVAFFVFSSFIWIASLFNCLYVQEWGC